MNLLPRSLFLKIFLWFGATVVTMMVITFVVGVFASHQHMAEESNIILTTNDDTAAQIYEREGQQGLVAYLDQTYSQSRVHTFLYSAQLVELSGRPAPPAARELATAVLQTNKPAFSMNEDGSLMANLTQSANSGRYVWVTELRPHPGSPLTHHIEHLFGLSLIGALFCFWLARYLTAPVATLRQATRELAGGNLAVRVAPSLGKRRDELASLGADFDVMAEQIESLLVAQRRLLGDISHELRSPLARLNIALELARQRAGREAESALARMQREAETLNEMIGQLLALTRLETGGREMRTSNFDLAKLVRNIAEDAEFEAESRNRSVHVSSCASCIISGNEELLRSAIENVVRNAVQHTAEGSAVEIFVERDTNGSVGASLPASPGNHKDTHNNSYGDRFAAITVRDHGNGVPENAVADIFRPFYRVDDARDRVSGGTGLGLAITERAVRLHGGSVAASNADTGGLVVQIIIPVDDGSGNQPG